MVLKFLLERKKCNFLWYDKLEVNMGNCSKEYSWGIVEKFWKREWEKIKQIDFPRTREFDITDVECSNELRNLRDGVRSNKAQSKTIIKCHPSMRYANRKGCLSPYDYWQLLKEDSELFKKFYENRLRCSDWFNEKQGKNFHYLSEGYVPEFIYGIGLSTSRKAPLVSYFKPSLAKNLILKYLNDFDTIYDPCSGYSGRLIGALCAGKNFVGSDINDVTISESASLYEYIKPLFPKLSCDLFVEDIFKNSGKAPCILTCTPYADIEEWVDSKGNKITSKYDCDAWIDIIMERFDCERYIFVTDGNILKWKPYVVEVLENTSHFGKNNEFVVMVERT